MMRNDKRRVRSQRRFSWKRRLDSMAARGKLIGVAGAVGLLLVGSLITYIVAPWQELRSQRAVQEEQERRDRETVPARIENARMRPTVRSHSSSRVYPPSAGTQALGQEKETLGPDEVLIGPPVAKGGDLDDKFRTFEIVQFTVVGQRSEPVQVVDIRTRVIERLSPPSGTLFIVPLQGFANVKKIFLDLDSPSTPGHAVAECCDNPTKDLFFAVNSATVERGERIDFAAVVSTAECHCSFELDVTFNDGTKIVVNENGRPWWVSSYAREYQVAYIMRPAEGPDVDVRRCDWPDDCPYG